MTEEYEAALSEVRKATAAFRLAQKAYRARKIDDAEFLAAKRIYDAAERDFDRAYDIECQLHPQPVPMDEALEADGQKLLQLTGKDHGPW